MAARVNHQEAESIAECIIALITWRVADMDAIQRPSPEAKHWVRECYAILDKFPDAVRTEAEICVSRRAA
jgi:hypothetical protein